MHIALFILSPLTHCWLSLPPFTELESSEKTTSTLLKFFIHSTVQKSVSFH